MDQTRRTDRDMDEKTVRLVPTRKPSTRQARWVAPRRACFCWRTLVSAAAHRVMQNVDARSLQRINPSLCIRSVYNDQAKFCCHWSAASARCFSGQLLSLRDDQKNFQFGPSACRTSVTSLVQFRRFEPLGNRVEKLAFSDFPRPVVRPWRPV